MDLPRYFVPRSTEPAPPARAPLLQHVLDAFRWVSAAGTRDVALVSDRKGAVHRLEVDALPEALRAPLRRLELTRKPRTVVAEELWWLDLQLLEQLPDTPGINDPVYLYGRLYGHDGCATGQLAVTRADVLAGLVDGARDALPIDGRGRCHHLVLPGDQADVVAQGRAIVVAVPLVPAELSPPDAANEALCARLCHDLLGALKADLVAAGVDHFLATTELPVPDRAEVVRQLEADGWTVRGNVAHRDPEVAKQGLGAFLTMVFGRPDAAMLRIPDEATLPELLDLARRVLVALPGWPDDRARALAARRATSAPARAPVDPPKPSPPPPRAVLPPKPADDWTRDFVQSHQQEKKPRLTRPAGKPGRPGWMDDFD